MGDYTNMAGYYDVIMTSGYYDYAKIVDSLVDATLQTGQGVVTLNLNVSFLRPAKAGELSARAHFLRQGRDVCHVHGVLSQNGKEVASAVAVCKIVTI